VKRFRAEGEPGLVDRSHRPHRSPNQTSSEIEDLVVAVRESYPVWGGRKIRGFLLRQGHAGIPAASTITAILRRRGLLAETASARGYVRFEHPAPNALWQMDFKGWFLLAGGSRVHTLGVLDDHSRYNLCLQACVDQQGPTVKQLLVPAFERYGLPEVILCDNGPPWGNGHSHWTPLGVWLIDLGITVTHSRPRHPQTAGKQERFHRTLDLEVIGTRPTWHNIRQLQDAYDSYRTLYNHHRPHQALGETTVPADRYQPSPRSMPNRINPPEYLPGIDVRIVDTGRIWWRGHHLRVGKPFNKKPVAIYPTTTDGTYTVYYRHHPIKTIHLSRITPNTRPTSTRS
jgi:transposase InsO family protein